MKEQTSTFTGVSDGVTYSATELVRTEGLTYPRSDLLRQRESVFHVLKKVGKDIELRATYFRMLKDGSDSRQSLHRKS